MTNRTNDALVLEEGRAGKPRYEASSSSLGCCEMVIVGICWFINLLFLPLALMFGLKIVQEYERAVIFRLGKLKSGQAQGPGMFFVLMCIDSYQCVDLRVHTYDVAPQEILTKDSVTVQVDAVVYYRVADPCLAITAVEQYKTAVGLLAQTTLRTILGQQTLGGIMSERVAIAAGMQQILDEATDPWGICISRVEVKNVVLPHQMQRAMAAEAEANRDARAKVIAAEGEQKASRALKEAADILASSPAAIQLRYLQTLTSISAEKNSTIIFPLPIEMLSAYASKM